MQRFPISGAACKEINHIFSLPFNIFPNVRKFQTFISYKRLECDYKPAMPAEMPFIIEPAMPFRTARAKKNRKTPSTQASHVSMIFAQISTGRKKFRYVRYPVSKSVKKSENGESGRMLNIFITMIFKICIMETSLSSRTGINRPTRQQFS